ncbi:MAG: peptidase A8 [Rhodothermales bacterium]|nr:peptidase A8 [Rhodothermales bacterium]
MRVLWISIIAVLADQVTKVLVVRNMYQHQSIPILGDWLKLTYLENPGMAFGISFGPPAMISIFSVIATFLIVFYLVKVRHGFLPYRASIGLVLGGAFGNIIDRVFYGTIYYDNPLFQGRVVDFIHVDIWRGILPEWIPLMGGNSLALFPIWNVADMAIVVGVVGILIFQKKFHDKLVSEIPATADDSIVNSSASPAITSDAHETAVNESVPVAAAKSDGPLPAPHTPGSDNNVSRQLPKNPVTDPPEGADSTSQDGSTR